MSYTSKKDSENAILIRASIGLAFCLILMEFFTPDRPWLFLSLMIWQYIHMYIIGRKEISFGNFDGLDLITGIPVLYFFFTCPVAYILSFGVMYLLTGRRSVRF